jgi:hypothetical protein
MGSFGNVDDVPETKEKGKKKKKLKEKPLAIEVRAHCILSG